MMRDDLEHAIREALPEEARSISFSIEYPPASAAADYATNAALVAAKVLARPPHAVAEELCSALLKRALPSVEVIEVAGPGFVNFHLTPEFFSDALTEARTAGEKWGSNTSLSKKKIMVEYTDPNPFKEFHIGHLMSNSIGESIARLLEASGAEVKRANYQGDVGLHVAKAIWQLQKTGTVNITDVLTVARAYTEGTKEYENDPVAKEEINDINKKIYDKSDLKINRLYDTGREISLRHFDRIYKALGTTFDFYFFESEMAAPGTAIVKKYIGSVFEESDGAVVYRGTGDLHTRVFLNSLGLPTYEAKELALAFAKEERWPADRSLVITASEVNDYFRVVQAALTAIAPTIAAKLTHIGHGFMRLSTGKMSSRTGNIITGESLIADMVAASEEKIGTRDVRDRRAVAQRVAVAAIKYSILKQATNRDIIFDEKQSLSFEGDSGPYLQYAHTRCSSILRKAQEEGIGATTSPSDVGDVEPARLLPRFPEVVLRATQKYEPHYVAQYLTELAGAFNAYYARERILDGGPDAPQKLAIVDAVRQTLKNGLHLLGIEAPEEM